MKATKYKHNNEECFFCHDNTREKAVFNVIANPNDFYKCENKELCNKRCEKYGITKQENANWAVRGHKPFLELNKELPKPTYIVGLGRIYRESN